MIDRWSKTEDDIVRSNWGKVNADAIAKLVKRTKNAVIGRARRLNLPLLQIGYKGVKKKTINPAIKNAIDKTLGIKIIHENIHRSRLDRLDPKNGCKWLYGDPATNNFAFCGYKKATGAPYCVDHCLQAFTERKHERA